MENNHLWYQVFPSQQEALEVMPIGKLQLIKIGELKICLVHSMEGFYAIEDACPHLGESLSKGHLNAFGEVTCPWHSYRYDLKNGAECRTRSKPAKTFPIKLNEKGLLVGIPSALS